MDAILLFLMVLALLLLIVPKGGIALYLYRRLMDNVPQRPTGGSQGDYDVPHVEDMVDEDILDEEDILQ